MDSPAEVGTHLHHLHEAVWELAALAMATRPGADPALVRAAEHVLAAAGWRRGSAPAPGVAEMTGGDWSGIAAQAATGILQSAALLSGTDVWAAQTDDAILAQGRASAQGAPMMKAFAMPMMPGLADLLAGGAPVMLDVGVGVGAMAVAYCETFPGLHVVGLDVLPRALDLARRTIDDAGMADRIELRNQDVGTLEDRDVFALAWLPAPFVPEAAIREGLPRMVRALVPGGWIVVGHGKFGGGPLSASLTRFQTVAFGGTALDDDEAESLLRSTGLEDVRSLPTPEGVPGLTVGRRPAGSG